MKPLLNRLQWLALEKTTRVKIAEIFGIRPSGFTHVQDGLVLSDGFSDSDIAQITVERLQEFLGSKGNDFHALFKKLVEIIETPIKTNAEKNEGKKTEQVEGTAPKGNGAKKGGRTKAKKD